MARKNPELHTTIGVLKTSCKKLDTYKAHPKQPYWEVIKQLLDGEIKVCGKYVQNNKGEIIVPEVQGEEVANEPGHTYKTYCGCGNKLKNDLDSELGMCGECR